MTIYSNGFTALLFYLNINYSKYKNNRYNDCEARQPLHGIKIRLLDGIV